MKVRGFSLVRVLFFSIIVLVMSGCSSSTEPPVAPTQDKPSLTVESPGPDRVPVAPTSVPSPNPAIVAAASQLAESMEAVPTSPPTANPPPDELPMGATGLTILHTNDVAGYVDPCG